MTVSEPSHRHAPSVDGGSWAVHESVLNRDAVSVWAAEDPRLANWPVVYLLDGPSDEIYVGETVHATSRMMQHLANREKAGLKRARVVVDPSFNKSATLDFESRLIEWVHADGRYSVDNRNAGIVDADYHARDWYRERFAEIAQSLKAYEGGSLLSSTIAQLENSDLYKLSPFKTPTDDQYLAIETIVGKILDGLREQRLQDTVALGRAVDTRSAPESFVVEGEPGTGKTVVAIFLMKLLVDIASYGGDLDFAGTKDGESGLSTYFSEPNQSLLKGLRIGYVIPQQSLRQSVSRVFSRTAGLDSSMVLSPLQVGEDPDDFDLLIVDEAHRLSRYAAQSMGTLTARFKAVHARLFGAEDREHTQLDWMRARSRFQVFLMDGGQAVRTSDVPASALKGLADEARSHGRYFRLSTQMRVIGGQEYVREIRRVLHGEPARMTRFSDYDFRIYSDPEEMRRAIVERERECGLSRMLAGYAWEWRSKGLKPGQKPEVSDIVIDRLAMRWNSTPTDWISSPAAIDEVGSIHTVQGYDLNYAGVIIGPDLRFDAESGQTVFDRAEYKDRGARANNGMLRISFTDEDLLKYVRNIYTVLLTRGMRGTYVHAVDAPLQEHLCSVFPDSVY